MLVEGYTGSDQRLTPPASCHFGVGYVSPNEAISAAALVTVNPEKTPQKDINGNGPSD